MQKSETEKFFNMLSVEIGTDRETATKIYYNFVRFIVKTANSNNVIRLPNFGDFVIKIYKSKVATMKGMDGFGIDGKRTVVPPRRIMSFKPDRKLKQHLNKQL